MALSMFLYSLCEALGKYLTSSYEPAQIIFLRSSVGILIVAWVTFNRGIQAYKTEFKLNITRNLLAATGLLLTLYSLKNLPLSSHEFISLMSPVFISLISAIFLKERLSLIIFFSISLSLIGVIIMSYPFKDTALSIGFCFALLSMLFNASAAVATKRIAHLDNLILYSTYILTCFIVSGVFAYDSLSLNLRDIPLFCLITILHFLAFQLLIQAFRREDLIKLAPLEYTSALWAITLGYIFWQYLPSHKELWGGSLIILGSLLVSMKKLKI